MVKYRFAQESDENVLTQLHLQFIDAKTNENNFFELFQNTSDFFRRSLSDGHCEAVLAEDEERIIGVGVIYYYQAIPTLYNMKGFTAHIVNLFVTLKYRNQGIGGNIIKMLLESAKKRGVEAIFAASSSISLKLFQEHGFADVNNVMIFQN